MIKTTELSKKYGETTVLNIESLEIPKGQAFGLVGNNGAGKTTYFNLLLLNRIMVDQWVQNHQLLPHQNPEHSLLYIVYCLQSYYCKED